MNFQRPVRRNGATEFSADGLKLQLSAAHAATAGAVYGVRPEHFSPPTTVPRPRSGVEPTGSE
jgi:hypothetical protein